MPEAQATGPRAWACRTVMATLGLLGIATYPLSADITVNLTYEFDGNSVGTTVFGTVNLAQNADNVDFTITADTAALDGGDIHHFYFNLPSDVTGLAVVAGSWGGTSNKSIGPPDGTAFSILGPSPSPVGGAGAAFDWGVDFGDGGGKPGNGTLTQATFTLMADQTLAVTDFLGELSYPNNTPPVFMAVHFQGTDVFGEDSETIGGGPLVPAPAAAVLGITGLMLIGWKRHWRT